MPVRVADDERILRAIYSPYHLDKKNNLKHQAYDPTPQTDEVSVMRLEHMGSRLCKRKAKSLENAAQSKVYRGFAVLKTRSVRASQMDVTDSRKNYSGHADIRFLMDELKTREPGEPLAPEAQKRFKDMKAALLLASNYVPDPNPHTVSWQGRRLEPPA